ncbi:endonuclease/exonuclease/phosphatase family protein [Sulfuriferula nivalis]|uniref:EEP domain-containing protein n=1 Tax=Sulfuriferula nivalis TaxID=2675298 RepID=A0A809SA52_9PROT|nr:endonuclease/exonuclease/phosphatase family protein [Sulfuriferula nivalis]BBP01362.1 EEP domain-containing protein [Sulfuriferula nivalis]
MTKSIRVVSYNIHKGFTHFNRRMVIHDLRERLRSLQADVVFLQEVQGSHATHGGRWHDWPSAPQYEFLADEVWSDFAYGKNAVYDHGHHGNAILSRYPIVASENLDVSAHAFESRGLLHAQIAVPGLAAPVHLMCVHLALFEHSRQRQLAMLIKRVHETVPDTSPLIIAGDFNDWRGQAGRKFATELGLEEAFMSVHGQTAKSFPAHFPLLSLDRIYVRGWRVVNAQVLQAGDGWHRSDHAALLATLELE